jgi:predicted RNA polymerase sigma factor
MTIERLAETFAAALGVVRDERRELPDEPIAWPLTIASSKLIDSVRRALNRKRAMVCG